MPIILAIARNVKRENASIIYASFSRNKPNHAVAIVAINPDNNIANFGKLLKLKIVLKTTPAKTSLDTSKK